MLALRTAESLLIVLAAAAIAPAADANADSPAPSSIAENHADPQAQSAIAEEDADSPAQCTVAEADVWVVSTRHLPCCPARRELKPQYWQLAQQDGGQWVDADEAAFLAADSPGVPTVFYLHGNRTSHGEAIAIGLTWCARLRALASIEKFRFVIWSWPADRIRGRTRRDVQVKDVRSHIEAIYLARVLDRMHPHVPVSAIGHSYGAQTIVGALKLLAGGRYAGQVLPQREAPARAPMRAVLVAAAMPRAALADSDPDHSALRQTDRVLVTRNGCDPVLRLYPRLYGRRGPAALGYAGPAYLDPQDPNTQKVDVLDLTWAVGKCHAWYCYLGSAPFQARLAWYTFLEKSEEAGPEAGEEEAGAEAGEGE